MSLYVSVSQLKAYLRCPAAYELRYVRGAEQEFLPLPLVFGSAIHTALAYWYGTTKLHGFPELEELAQAFTDAWDKAIAGPIPVKVDDEEEDVLGVHRDKGVAMLAAFRTQAIEDIPAVDAIEHPFEVDLHDPDTGEILEERLKGFIDLVVWEDAHRIVVEHKTSARKYAQDVLRYDFQLTAYQFAAKELGWGEVGLRFQVITKTKTPAVHIDDVRRDATDEHDFLRTAAGVLKAIDTGAFFPIRGHQCRSCQFQKSCASRSRRAA